MPQEAQAMAPPAGAAAAAASDPWASAEADTWSELLAELQAARPLQRRWTALRWWLARWLDPGYRRHALLPLDKHVPNLVAAVGRAFLIALAYVVLRTVYGEGMAPGGSLWALCLVWVCAFHAGEAFERCGAPKALGMLLAGLALRLLPGAPGAALPPPLEGLSDAWSLHARAGAMALIMLRAGLGINVRTIVRYGWSFAAMCTLPALLESLLGAAVAMSLFDMPFLLAWSMSFMIAAVGPAVITAGCASVKERGYAPTAPNFLMACCCFDDATCIIGFNCVLHAYIGAASNDYGYLMGPAMIVLSPLGGVAAACVLSATAIWCTPARRSGVLVVTCAMLMYVASSYEQIGAGAIANLTLGLATRHAWLRGWPYALLSGDHRADVGRAGTEMLLSAHRHLSVLWHAALYPLLFGLLGASFNVAGAGASSSVRAVAYAFVAIGIRAAATATVTQAMPRFTRRERIFLALSWCSKAAAQAAFAGVPRALITNWIASHPGQTLRGAPASQLMRWADDISWSCTCAIFISNPIAMLCINNGAYFLLGRTKAHSQRSGGGGGGGGALFGGGACCGAAPKADGGGGAESDSDLSAADDCETDLSSLPDLFGAAPGAKLLFDDGAVAVARLWAPPTTAAADAAADHTHAAAAAAAAAGPSDVAAGLPHGALFEMRPLMPPTAADVADAPSGSGGAGGSAPPSVDTWQVPPPGGPDADAAAAALADSAADAAAGAPPGASATSAAAAARVVFTYADVGPAHEAAVRAALLAASGALADILPSGVEVELRREQRATSTHANRFEDPNDDADAAEVTAPAAVPPSQARMRRRLAACIGGAARGPADAGAAGAAEGAAWDAGGAPSGAPRATAVLAFSSEAQRARTAW